MKQRILVLVAVLVMLVVLTAVPAAAHNGYIDCASGYDPVTWSISYDTNGTHTHTLHGTWNNWSLKNVLQGHIWSYDGFWGATAPGTHNGYATCTPS